MSKRNLMLNLTNVLKLYMECDTGFKRCIMDIMFTFVRYKYDILFLIPNEISSFYPCVAFLLQLLKEND